MAQSSTQHFSATVNRWAGKTQERLEAIFREAVRELFNRVTQTQASIKETGTFTVGKVPVDTGELIGSTEIRLDGRVVARGSQAGKASTPPDYAVTISRMAMGQVIGFVFTSEHARHVEYGTENMPGRFFVSMHVREWQSIVDDVVRRVAR